MVCLSQLFYCLFVVFVYLTVVGPSCSSAGMACKPNRSDMMPLIKRRGERDRGGGD